MRAAWDIAWLVEGERARERFRLKGGRRNSVHRTVAAEFDPHAATELALLIQSRCSPSTTANSVGIGAADEPKDRHQPPASAGGK